MIIKKITEIELNQDDISQAIIHWMLNKFHISIKEKDVIFFRRDCGTDYNINELICEVKISYD